MLRAGCSSSFIMSSHNPALISINWRRFQPQHFMTVMTVLGLSASQTIRVNKGCVLSNIECLAMFLMRLSTLGGNGEIALIFQRPVSTVSALSTFLASELFWGKLEALASFNHAWINHTNCASWGQAMVQKKFFPLTNIVGFLGKLYSFFNPL